MYSLSDLVKEIEEKENGVVNVTILNVTILIGDNYYFMAEGLCRRLDFDLACLVCQKMFDAERIPDGE